MRRTAMNERLTWAQIMERFPEQWVRLENVEMLPDNDATIASGVVTRAGEYSAKDDVDKNCRQEYVDCGDSFYIGAVTV